MQCRAAGNKGFRLRNNVARLLQIALPIPGTNDSHFELCDVAQLPYFPCWQFECTYAVVTNNEWPGKSCPYALTIPCIFEECFNPLNGDEIRV